jgi:hypothetical protein
MRARVCQRQAPHVHTCTQEAPASRARSERRAPLRSRGCSPEQGFRPPSARRGRRRRRSSSHGAPDASRAPRIWRAARRTTRGPPHLLQHAPLLRLFDALDRIVLDRLLLAALVHGRVLALADLLVYAARRRAGRAGAAASPSAAAPAARARDARRAARRQRRRGAAARPQARRD